MYAPISKLKDKPLTISLGPFFKKKWSKTTSFGAFGHPQMDVKMYTKVPNWARCISQCLSLKINP
jgi:hypothetical protein